MSDQPKSWLDQLLGQVIGNGDVSHMQGAGKRLSLDEDAGTPEELRLAHKIMRENGILPVWMQLGQELDTTKQTLLQNLRQAAHQYRGQVADARRAHSVLQEQAAEKRWQTIRLKFQEDIQRYNQQLLTYNLSIPPHMEQRVPLNAHEELARVLR